jgi:competence protein ComEA
LIAACVIVGMALLGTVVLVAKSGLFGSRRGEIKFAEAGVSESSGSTEESPAEPAKICVHVVGKVGKPGLYELEPGSRVMDAIKAAGGAAPNADLESINLAEKLLDGQQVYIAQKGKIEPPRMSVVRGGSAPPASGHEASSPAEDSRASGPDKLTTPGQGTVNINSAGLEELQRLPGVGPATAQKIVDYRSANGRFESVDELDEISGIGPAKLEKMRPFVTL